MSNVQYSIVGSGEDAFITVFVAGAERPGVAPSDHPNFDAIVAAAKANDPTVLDLFDIGQKVADQFRQLTERVAVKNGVITFDGDPVHGTLQDQILDFLDAGEDFGPLVNFYEKLATNPLGDVREGLYDWIEGQKSGGALTITPEGDLLGYKSVQSHTREDGTTVYRPSRPGAGVVNGVDVKPGQYIEQVPGDTVEMPRSTVLHAPSQLCGDGLHIGTWNYASTFYGDTVMLVQFSPRDIVSLPDNNSSWKLRVCRYKVVEPVTEPLVAPVYGPVYDESEDDYEDYEEMDADDFPEDESDFYL
jgi:hypothetical protein